MFIIISIMGIASLSHASCDMVRRQSFSTCNIVTTNINTCGLFVQETWQAVYILQLVWLLEPLFQPGVILLAITHTAYQESIWMLCISEHTSNSYCILMSTADRDNFTEVFTCPNRPGHTKKWALYVGWSCITTARTSIKDCLKQIQWCPLIIMWPP